MAQTSIQAIKRGDVHRIASGQVVLDLRSAVKELVENALDAGSTTIEIRFKEYGLDAIEVIDNGTGIEEKNYPALALKHHTSKLVAFSDLADVQTFGFRGEALSSLCALARIHVTTATQQQEPVGRVLEFDRDGTLITPEGKKAPRKRGTTVVVSDLFYALPVRRRELARNVKREFAKTQSMLQAYVIVTPGVRWVVTNVANGRKIPVMTVSASDPASDYFMSNFKAIFGAKSATHAIPLDLSIPLTAAKLHSETRRSGVFSEQEEAETNDDNEPDAIIVRGIVSRPSIGCGRSSSDRCFLYINGRPWDAPKVVKAFNEVYRHFNVQQAPMVVADFVVRGSDYDVNVSPDKRTLFLHREAEIIERLKAQLEHSFSPFQSQFKVNRLASPTSQHSKLFFATPSEAASQAPPDSDEAPGQETNWSQVDVRQFTLGKRGRTASHSSNSDDIEQNRRSDKQTRSHDDLSDDERGRQGEDVHDDDLDMQNEIAESESQNGQDEEERDATTVDIESDTEQNIATDVGEGVDSRQSTRRPSRVSSISTPRDAIQRVGADRARVKPMANLRRQLGRFMATDSTLRSPSHASEEDEDELIREGGSPSPSTEAEVISEDQQGGEEVTEGETQTISGEDENESGCETMTEARPSGDWVAPASDDEQEEALSNVATDIQLAEKEDENCEHDVTSDIAVRFDLAALLPSMADLHTNEIDDSEALTRESIKGAAVSEKDASVAEAALSRFIEKTDFKQMDIVGQFNLGFIIARRNRTLARRTSTNATQEDDLFIIDQHAADEKYNFEHLTRVTKLESQKLVVPRTLQLSPTEELIAMEHAKSLSAHGFHIQVDEGAPPGTRVSLVALPMTKNITFTVADFEEVLHKLTNEPADSQRAGLVRCSKFRDVLASRACRKSIMIGKALKTAQMEKVVTNLGALDQPWNCPHGRPTMRHLYDLGQSQHRRRFDSDGKVQEINWGAIV